MADLSPEDAKLVVLARGARQRAYAPHSGVAEGAAVRDTDGRSYAAATVEMSDPSATVSALHAAVVAAASSGARTFEAAVVATDAPTVTEADLVVLREFGAGVPVLVASANGAVGTTVTT